MPKTGGVKRHAVSLSAVVQRLNRHLDAEDQIVRAPRGRGRGERTFFLVDRKKGAVVVDGLTPAKLEELARKLKVISDWEAVVP
jgi:hypothetical protein